MTTSRSEKRSPTTWAKGEPMNVGSDNPKAKLDDEAVREIRALRAQYPGCRLPKEHPASLHALAKRYGVTPVTICKVARGFRWRHVR